MRIMVIVVFILGVMMSSGCSDSTVSVYRPPSGNWASIDGSLAFNLQFGEGGVISGFDDATSQSLTGAKNKNVVSWTLQDGTVFAGELISDTAIRLDGGQTLNAISDT